MAYDADTTTNEIIADATAAGIDLTDRRFVITGASSGLGEESTRALAGAGARITMLARSPEKLDAAAARVREAVPDAQLDFGTVDLAEFSSIRACAAALNDAGDPIDVLINNAGVMACPQGTTADGFEMQFGTNHLGHFLLTALLFPAVQAGADPRIVNLSSGAHSISDVVLDDINFEQSEYDAWEAYGRSKTANALFSRGLAQRFGDSGLVSFSVHPGAIMTELGRHLTDELMEAMMSRAKARAESAGESSGGMHFKSVEAGAATQVWASIAAEAGDRNGSYLADCQFGEPGGNPSSTGFSDYLLDDATTDRLWTLSEELTGASFG
ncbi:MAG: SDR family NAD(P)-dependent oxidoreductase [Acidimicrobiales bacterium]|nr:SDR family NAD(P)-dependent oxidoreductase [Acidimicrobiales bacterium]